MFRRPHWSDRRPKIAAELALQRQLLIGCDFDGTLAPIAAHPRDAALAPGAREALVTLAARPNVHVAVFSGRALDDVRERVGLPEVIYVGNHGLEISGPGLREWNPPVSHSSRREMRLALEQLREGLARVPGVLVEDKRLTGSVHYRMAAAERHEEVARLVRVVTTRCRTLAARQGREVWELRPRLAWNHSAALRNLLAHRGLPESAALYLGDDIADEDVFVSLPYALTFHAGRNAATAARFRLHSPEDAVELLRWVLAERGRC